MSHYDVLGVAPDASPSVIHRAYVSLARTHHPDFFVTAPPGTQADAERRMREVNQAWAVLSDTTRRADYDAEHGLRPDPHDFQPFEPDEPGDVDPRDEPDVPYRPMATRDARRSSVVAFVPVALLIAAIAILAAGVVVAVPALLALGVIVLVIAGAGFIVAPLLALSRATRDEG